MVLQGPHHSAEKSTSNGTGPLINVVKLSFLVCCDIIIAFHRKGTATIKEVL
jgi:hypothetical protein